MNESIKWISYERGNYGYQIKVYPPTEQYPMYQICHNDDDCVYPYTTIRQTMEEVEDVIASILSHADAWQEVA